MLTGQNGILTNASKAKNETGEAQIEEKVKLSVGDALTRGTGTLEDENLKSALNSYIGKDNYSIKRNKANGWAVTINEKSYDISSMGKISKSLPSTAEGQPADTPIKNPTGYGENAQATADGDGKYFAKPDGATYLEGTVDTGVVVSIKGSEFVWVPVDDVVLDTSDTSKTEKLPKSSDAGTSSGNTYTPMAVQVGNDYKGILYDFSGSNGYLKYGRNASTNYQGGSAEYKEPAVVSKYDGTDTDTVEGKITIDKLTKEYKAMIESVKKYKGFYVARYEAGLETGTNKIVFKNASLPANNCTTTDASNSETKSWYGLYKKIKTFTTSSDKVVSSMIWGSQYDAMMNWMAKTGKEVGKEDDTKRNTTTITGKTEEGKKPDIINNIYDLYGCHFEWTLEADRTTVRTFRGGSYLNSLSPASRNVNYPNDTLSSTSSRATLYIE